VRGIEERTRIVEPVEDRCIFFFVQFELNRFERLSVEYVVSVIEWWFLIVERRESHSLEMPSIPLLPPH